MVRINKYDLPGQMARRQGEITPQEVSPSSGRLQEGLKAVRAAESPAELRPSEKMRSQLRSHNQAIYDVQQEITGMQTAKGGLEKIQSLLHRVREVLVSALGSTGASLKEVEIKKEISKLLQEVDRIAAKTRFSGEQLPEDPSSSPVDTEALGLSNIFPPDRDGTSRPLEQVDHATALVSSQQSLLEEAAKRLEHTLEELLVGRENIAASQSLIRDAAAARDTMERVKQHMQQKTGTATPAHTNMDHQRILKVINTQEQ